MFPLTFYFSYFDGFSYLLLTTELYNCRDNSKEFQLVFGEHDMYNVREKYREQTSNLNRLIVHPKVETRRDQTDWKVWKMLLFVQFDPISFENDLALLELEEPVKYEANVVPACLPQASFYIWMPW